MPVLCPQETEKIIAELNETWEEKLRKTEALRMERCVGWGLAAGALGGVGMGREVRPHREGVPGQR